MSRRLKIALVSTGLGRIRRGFESFTESLFLELRRQAPELEVRLFQGGGCSSDKRHRIANLQRADAPARWFGEHRANLLEKRSFAIALYPRLRLGGFEVVHYNELVMGSSLWHLRRLFGGSFRLLYCNGAPSPPVHYHHRCDFAQMLTGPMYEEANAFGVAESRLFLVPYAVDADLFRPGDEETRRATRNELSIPQDAFVVLSVAAIKSEHKRIDYIIREVGRMRSDVWLLVAGQRTAETCSLERLADECLPSRWRFVSWPNSRVPALYGAADAFALASSSEAFGMVVIEALACELPVVLHDHPTFQWILGDELLRHSPRLNCLADLSSPGSLASRLQVWRSENGGLRNLAGRERVVKAFDWRALLPRYLEMYAAVCRHTRRQFPLC